MIRFRLPDGARPTGLKTAVGATATGGDGRLSLTTDDPVRALHALTGWALQRKVALTDLTVERPTLEDVYLAVTEQPA